MDEIDISLHYLETVDSTNVYVKNNVDTLADGALVYAGTQTAGRGRLGRVWHSPPGRNFYGSLLLKRLENPLLGTMVVSLGALAALRSLAPELAVWLKWPNDLYVGGRKLAGVLSETADSAGGARMIVVGIGVNLNTTEEELSLIDRPAASVFAAVGCKINPDFFASELARYAKTYYIMGIFSGNRLFDEWRKCNSMVGLDVELDLGGGRLVTGLATGIAPDGALLVRDARGIEKPYYCGDASITREAVRRLAERLAGTADLQ